MSFCDGSGWSEVWKFRGIWPVTDTSASPVRLGESVWGIRGGMRDRWVRGLTGAGPTLKEIDLLCCTEWTVGCCWCWWALDEVPGLTGVACGVGGAVFNWGCVIMFVVEGVTGVWIDMLFALAFGTSGICTGRLIVPGAVVSAEGAEDVLTWWCVVRSRSKYGFNFDRWTLLDKIAQFESRNCAVWYNGSIEIIS